MTNAEERGACHARFVDADGKQVLAFLSLDPEDDDVVTIILQVWRVREDAPFRVAIRSKTNKDTMEAFHGLDLAAVRQAFVDLGIEDPIA